MKNSQYVIHNFRTDYQQRPKIFESLSPCEFSNNKVNNVHSHQFHQDHPQYKTHCIYEYEYKVPKILVIQYHHKKMIQKIILKQFIFCFHHGEV